MKVLLVNGGPHKEGCTIIIHEQAVKRIANIRFIEKTLGALLRQGVFSLVLKKIRM